MPLQRLGAAPQERRRGGLPLAGPLRGRHALRAGGRHLVVVVHHHRRPDDLPRSEAGAASFSDMNEDASFELSWLAPLCQRHDLPLRQHRTKKSV